MELVCPSISRARRASKGVIPLLAHRAHNGDSMPSIFRRIARWLLGKSAPQALLGPQWFGPFGIDAYRRQRPPTSAELLSELKNTAWTCASINAAVCASFPPRLFVTTAHDQPAPRCLTRALPPATVAWLREAPHVAVHTHKAVTIEEVTEHPLLSLLRQVNVF